ncbi:Type 1 glutamine amidotransferase-like domain-containing protein [Shewanella olleyana]|uniref:Type 1 glutamine amidotransferase-like domain-containing protein n=1 Tax=Shewanella olleyana TaxID=135626 RepID=UPI00200C3E8B|nr:Type 1 glutamine amidotransferase-like domain-containing protein [Shewanella olleyana]MCL1066689.1 Type 1 glutamine amidotransferase-like domain-containing protein [Shewanella olleyana]
MNLVLLSNTTSVASIDAISLLIENLSADILKQPAVYIASEPDPQRQYFEPIKQMYQALGFEQVEYMELEQGFDANSNRLLKQSGMVHLSGGDTYRFLYWLKQRGIDKTLRCLADEGKPIVGVSAGAMIMTPSIDSAVLCGDQNQVGLADTVGLNLVSFLVVPHVSFPLKNEAKLKMFQQQSQYELLLLSDADAVTVLGNKQRIFGSPQLLK